MDHEEQSDFLRAMAHPVRLKMVKGLMSNECNVNSIVEKLGLPQSTVSQHLGILRRSGIIAAKKEGVRTCYRVVDKRARELIRMLKRSEGPRS